MKNVFMVLSFFLIIGCKKEANPSNSNKNNIFQPTNISFIEIGKGVLYGSNGGKISQKNSVIKDSVVWQNMLSRIDSINNVSQDFSEINIDFSTFEVLAVFDTIRPHNNFSIEISSVMEYQDSIMVNYETSSGNEGYSVLVKPFHIVKIPIKGKPIIFK